MKTRKAIVVLLAVMVAATFFACSNPWWPSKDQGTLRYDANGGVGTVPQAQIAELKTDVTVASQNGLTKSGYSFAGWNTKRAGDGITYRAGATLTLNGNITLYAIWVSNSFIYSGGNTPYNPSDSGGDTPYYPDSYGGYSTSTLTVTYHADASNPSAGAIPRATEYVQVTGIKPEDRSLYSPGSLAPVLGRSDGGQELQKDGFVFAEWVDDHQFIKTGNSLTSGSKFTITGHKDLYALWLEEDKVIEIQRGGSPMTETKKVTFEPQQVGYAPVTPQQMTIKNTESNAVGPLTIKISGDVDKFDLIPHFVNGEQITLGPNQILPFTIVPKTDLGAGNYSILIEITNGLEGDDRVYSAFLAGFEVTPVPPPPPPPLPDFPPNNDPPYSVTYIVGAGQGAAPAGGNYDAGKPVTLDDGTGLSYTGYTFIGWKNYDGAVYPPGHALTITGNLILSPKWSQEGDDLTVMGNLNVVLEKDYSYAMSGLEQHIWITNTSGGTLTEFTLIELTSTKRKDGKSAFDIRSPGYKSLNYGIPDDDLMSSAEIIAVPSLATGEMDAGKNVEYFISPKDGLDAGDYSIIITILNGTGISRTFYMTFTVLPLPLTVTARLTGYSNPNDFITPITDSLTNPVYTEREARFNVTVSGFAAVDDAISMGVVFGRLNAGAVNTAGFTTSSGAATGGISRTINAAMILSDTDGVTFPDGSLAVYVGLDAAAGVNYIISGGPQPVGDVTIHDGQAPTPNQLIPVNQTNVAAFNYYARTGGLARHYKQTQDIVLTGGAANWTAIGSYTSATVNSPFTGSYDGQGHYIEKLTCSNGMFGCIGAKGVVENLGLVNVNISNVTKRTGSLAETNEGTVKSCYVTGSVFSSNQDDVGGVIGWNGGTVQNCYFTGTVTGTNYVGGIVGSNGAGLVQNCYVTGTVTGTGSNSVGKGVLVGGLLGGVTTATVRNNVALNPSVTGAAAASNKRVIGQNRSSAPITNNYARANMLINGVPVPDAAANTVNGKGIGPGEYTEQSWWKDAANWTIANGATVWDFDTVWEWNNTTDLPILQGFAPNTQNHTVPPMVVGP